jgi:hypothetical protein
VRSAEIQFERFKNLRRELLAFSIVPERLRGMRHRVNQTLQPTYGIRAAIDLVDAAD